MGSHSDSRAEIARAQSSRMRSSLAGKDTLKKCHKPGSVPYTDPAVDSRVFSLSRLSSARSSSTSFISCEGLFTYDDFTSNYFQRISCSTSYIYDILWL